MDFKASMISGERAGEEKKFQLIYVINKMSQTLVRQERQLMEIKTSLERINVERRG